MKENVELVVEGGCGGDLLIDVFYLLVGSWGDKFELYLIGYLVGLIMFGRLFGNLVQKDLMFRVKFVYLYVLVCIVVFVNWYYVLYVEIMNKFYFDILSDQFEWDDNVVQVY